MIHPFRGLVVAALAVAAAAQEVRLVHQDDQGDPICSVQAFAAAGAAQGAGLGFLRVDAENVDDRTHVITVAIETPSWQDCDVRAERTVGLQPRRSTRFFLPLPVPPSSVNVVVTLDGGRRMLRNVDYARNAGAAALFVTDAPQAAPQGLELLQALPNPDGMGVEQVVCAAADLPNDWRLLTSFDVVVVDGRAALSAELQDTLRRYAFSGGAVVVAGPGQLAAGPLRDVASRAFEGPGGHGAGVVAAVPPLGAEVLAMRARVEALRGLGRGLWPAVDSWFVPQEIAELGKAPVTAFVLVILLFAVLVGPVNFLVLRRRRRPLLALLTVPALGFGTTALILLYGVLHDGFGVRGVAASWTALDQERHEAAVVNARTLFAGLAPNHLTMAPETMLLSLRAGQEDEGTPDRWAWDGDAQRLDGGVLPSRTVTPLLAVQEGPVRQRLTVRRVGADALEALPDSGVAPRGDMVLRDLAGDYWAGVDGRLSRVAADAGRQAFELLAARAARLRVAARPGFERDVAVPRPEPAWLGEPGTYVARVASAPWLDEQSLDVAYDQQQHHVFGRMQAQDFLP